MSQGLVPPMAARSNPSTLSTTSSSASSSSSTTGSSRRPSSPPPQHVLFRWTKAGEAVSVVGSWNGWGKPLSLERTQDAFGRGHLFSRMVELPPGRHQYKFVVDGAWQYDPQCAFEADEWGNINNMVDVEGDEEGGGGGPEESEEGGGGGSSVAATDAATRPMMVDPRHRVRNNSWTTMSGEQARSKWVEASEAMIRLNVTRSDSIEGVVNSLTMHERQQVDQNLKEYGLHTPGGNSSSHHDDASVAGPRKTVSLSVRSLAALNKSASQPNVTAVLAAAVEGQQQGTIKNAVLTSSGVIRPEEKESGSRPTFRVTGDDDIHPPPALHKAVSRRGSCLAASFLGSSSGGRLNRSRSLTDLDLIDKEYSNNSSLLFALPGGEDKPRRMGGGPALKDRKKATTLRILQKQQAACCAVVGSCQVKSTVRREGKMILAMVGLPGRGKTHIARAIRRHLEWLGMRVGYFNSSEYRRNTLGQKKVSPDFFDPTDSESWACRKEIAAQVLQDTLTALQTDIDIAVLDAANCTRARRHWIQDQVRASDLYATVIFIESICTIPEIIQTNVHQTILRSPEYADMSEAEAMADFERKNQHYLSIYETLEEAEDVPFLKLVDAGQKIVSFRINGYVPGRLLLLLANIHTQPRPIWFSRHGESVFNSQGRIGGDSPLSARGMLYAQKLDEFVHSVYKPDDPSDPTNPNLTVWTSTLVRTGMTVAHLNQSWEVIKWRCLDEIDAGMCDGLTYDEVAAQFPEEYRKRKEDKYNYRYVLFC